jgi:membrane protein implicated in regulation of membrane protease activity
MDSVTIGWWVATGALVAAELGTGTFYLLMLAIGTVAGALAAHAGIPFSGQLLAAALVGGGAAGLFYIKRSRLQRSRGGANRDLNLDIGERVNVLHWAADGTARVTYRGAAWDARHVGHGTALPGEHVIRGIEGTRLLLERVANN